MYKQSVEVVLLKGVEEPSIKTAAWVLNHLVGTLHVNTPLPEDSAKLKHIHNVTTTSKSIEIFKSMLKYVDHRLFPIHFLLACKNATMGSTIVPGTNALTIGRIYKAFKSMNKSYSEMVL